jgi:hypothetical protein
VFEHLQKLGFVVSFMFAVCFYSTTALAQAWQCNIDLSTEQLLVDDFVKATGMAGGGLSNPKIMWVAIVDRDGRFARR